jgi:hypothetical protein
MARWFFCFGRLLGIILNKETGVKDREKVLSKNAILYLHLFDDKC